MSPADRVRDWVHNNTDMYLGTIVIKAEVLTGALEMLEQAHQEMQQDKRYGTVYSEAIADMAYDLGLR